jgi:large subunit ribosomal protein L24e
MPFDSFSNERIPRGKGIMYIKKDGTVLYFKGSKTMKNMLNLKRDGRKIKWTQKTVSLRTDKKVEEKKESALSKDIEKKLAEKAAAKSGAKK